MARQRFIWPDLWSDPAFGRLAPLEQVLYIGCFSNADDEGRLLGDPVWLKSTILPYQNGLSIRKVKAARDNVLAKMDKLRLYRVDDIEYLAFLNWSEWQKPKYPKPSRFPEPLPECVPEEPPEAAPPDGGSDSPVGWVGLGRDGSEGVGKGSTKAVTAQRDVANGRGGTFQIPNNIRSAS